MILIVHGVAINLRFCGAYANPPAKDHVADGTGGWRNALMPIIVKTTLLLMVSNVFMTFAWYAHLKELNHKPWFVAAAISWAVAFFEYMFQVPANRIGHAAMTVGQLKILQEVITLTVFVPFAILYLREPVKLDYLWAALCLCGAVFFVFRGGVATG
jgi:uncharacterized protein (DUF486 family)